MPLVTSEHPKCTRPRRSTACTDLHAGTRMRTDLLVGIPSARCGVQLPGCNIWVRIPGIKAPPSYQGIRCRKGDLGTQDPRRGRHARTPGRRIRGCQRVEQRRRDRHRRPGEEPFSPIEEDLVRRWIQQDFHRLLRCPPHLRKGRQQDPRSPVRGTPETGGGRVDLVMVDEQSSA